MIDELLKDSNSNFDIDAFKKKKKDQKEFAYKTIGEELEKIKTNPELLKEYFDMQSILDAYSPRNILLIHKQDPDATLVKEWKKWKEAKVTFKDKYPKKIIILDPRDPFTTNSGKTIRSYTAKEVIDVSETNYKPIIKNYDKKLVLQALLKEKTIDIKAVDSLESGKLCEWNTDDKVIYIVRNDNLDVVIPALTNELVKINLYENKQDIDNDKAEGITYMICKKYGIDVPFNVENLFNKYKDMDTIDIANDLTTMKDILQEVNTNIRDYIEQKTKNNRSKEQER